LSEQSRREQGSGDQPRKDSVSENDHDMRNTRHGNRFPANRLPRQASRSGGLQTADQNNGGLETAAP
jgi:hypothetical protein